MNKKVPRITLASLLGFAGAICAMAQPTLFESHFGREGDAPCYARSYTDEHLKEHPHQRVTDIALHMSALALDGSPVTEEKIELGLGLRVKGQSHWYTGVALCKSFGSTMDCFLEGDGGRFSLTPANDRGLTLATGDYGIAIEGDSDVLELAGDRGDDRMFLLHPAERARCDGARSDANSSPHGTASKAASPQ